LSVTSHRQFEKYSSPATSFPLKTDFLYTQLSFKRGFLGLSVTDHKQFEKYSSPANLYCMLVSVMSISYRVLSLLCLTLIFSLQFFFVVPSVNFSCPEEYQTLNGILFQTCTLLSFQSYTTASYRNHV
jgi:hypothetical protein